MRKTNDSFSDQVREVITLNARKGELYRIAFADEPDREYEGLPMPPSAAIPEDEREFDLKIHSPEALRGRTVQCSIDDVVLLRKI